MWRSNAAACYRSIHVSSLVWLVLVSGPCAAVWDCDAWDAASVLSVSWGCFGCAGLGQQDKVDPAHSTVVYSQASVHPGLITVHCVQTHGTEWFSVAVSAVSMFGLLLREVNFPQLLLCFCCYSRCVSVCLADDQILITASLLFLALRGWKLTDDFLLQGIEASFQKWAMSVCPLGS